MEKTRADKIEVLDLIISVLMEHEKNIDKLEDRLEEAIQRLNESIDREDKRNATMLKYYEPITK